MYEKILRPLLFRFTDPEKIHHVVIKSLGFVSRQKFPYNFIQKKLANTDERLFTSLGNLKLNSPVGLAAGFDKYLEAPLAYPMLGFGFAELGSFTFSEQPGNPKPRLWRIPKDKGIIVYHGLCNDGAKKTAALFSNFHSHPIPYGISIAPTTGLKIEEMADDYVRSFVELHGYADYITLNVSCPNVAACDMFSQISFIEELAGKIRKTMDQNKVQKDIYIKISPHHSEADLDRIISACLSKNFTGIIATNLVKNRATVAPNSSAKELNHPGGISGRLLQNQSDATVKYLYQKSAGQLQIIGLGGIFTAEDAYRKIKLGASAVQIITGFIYGGPLVIKKINDGLIKLLERDGLKNIAEAIGKDVLTASDGSYAQFQVKKPLDTK